MSAKPRGVLIAGNWKMNLGQAETERFFADLRSLAGGKLSDADRLHLGSGRLRACIFPPMLSLRVAQSTASGLPFPMPIGAQNVHWEKKGAFTGEVSGPMLNETGITWALVGHSERRQYFGETDETARKRTESLLEQGFRVVLCIGETRPEREAGQTDAVISRQLAGAIPEAGKGAAAYLDGRLIIAYEPVWAIGTGLVATVEQVEQAHSGIRKLLEARFGKEAAIRTPVLYGGSVTPENVDPILACPNVDGALVGGASVKPESYLALLAGGGRALG